MVLHIRSYIAFVVFGVFSLVAHAQQQTILKILWEVNTGADYMTTQSTTERDMFTNRGAFMYAPYGSVSGTTPLYRLTNGADHMDSHVYGEGGYTTEGVTAYVWTSATAVSGLGQFNRLVNPSTNDHAEVKAGDTISGYTTIEAPGLYGYPRYNNTAENLLSLTAGGVTIESNLVAGASIWSWVWNGIEFINNSDYGRELQNAFDWTAAGLLFNPTMGGSKYSTDSVPGNRQGSPVYSATNSGNTQSTRTIPLEWNPDNHGGAATRPVIYHDMLLGKDVTLNYSNMGPVAKYDSIITLASAVNSANLEAPVAFTPDTFTRYYWYDAQSDVLSGPVTVSYCLIGNPGTTWSPSSGHGGVIVENSGQTAAIGIAGKTTTAAGNLAGFGLGNCLSADHTSVLNAYTGHVNFAAATTTITAFVITETLANVTAKMRQLYLQGDI